jgi:hydroxyethylthiazole kinase-like uncharacterized protein yjeF
MENLIKLYTSAQARMLDQQAMVVDHLQDGVLMERAGEAAYRHLRFIWPRARRITIVCGPGNNGGDGFVLARKLLETGLAATVLTVGDLDKQSGDALRARKAYQEAGGEIHDYTGSELKETDVLVDALLGIGSERDLQGPFAEIVTAINASNAPVFALDLPSGIDADRGNVLGVAIRATATLSFIGYKRGLLTSVATDKVGQLYVADLDVSDKAENSIDVSAYLLTETTCRELIPCRKRNTHKGEQGRLLIVGGATGMSGAVQMAGLSALRSGAGLVRIASPGLSPVSVPELMATQMKVVSDLERLLEPADVIAIGPGLGRDEFAHQLFGKVLDFRKKNQSLVIDADALVCLANESSALPGVVLTPHTGEAAALLSCSVSDIQRDRFAAAETIAKRFQGICVLKGAGTVISDGNECFVSDRGGPELASPGTGDVLTGIIAALLGQGLSPLSAATLGVFVHGMAGERAAKKFGIGLVATDLCEQASTVLTDLGS